MPRSIASAINHRRCKRFSVGGVTAKITATVATATASASKQRVVDRFESE